MRVMIFVQNKILTAQIQTLLEQNGSLTKEIETLNKIVEKLYSICLPNARTVLIEKNVNLMPV